MIGKRRRCCFLTGQGLFRRRPLTPGVCFTPLNFLAVGSHLGFQTACRRRRTQSAEPVKGWGPRRSKPVPRHLWHPRMTGGLVQKMVDAGCPNFCGNFYGRTEDQPSNFGISMDIPFSDRPSPHRRSKLKAVGC